MAYFRFETNLQNLYFDMLKYIGDTGIYEDISSNKGICHVFNSKGSTGADNILIIMGSADSKTASNTYKRMFVSLASDYIPGAAIGQIGSFVNLNSRYAPTDINFLKQIDGFAAVNYSVTPSVAINENTIMEVLLIVTSDYIQCCWWQKNMGPVSPLSNGFYVGLIDRLNPLDRKAQVLMPFYGATAGAGVDHSNSLRSNNPGICLILEDFTRISFNEARLAINAPKLLTAAYNAASDIIGYKGNGDNDSKLILFDIAVTSPALVDKYGLCGYLNGIKTFGFHAGYKNGDVIVDDNNKKYMYFKQFASGEANHFRTLQHCEDVYLLELR